jgi:hypothetical protein
MGRISMAEARQLSLFKGKRQRGIKPTGPSEFEIHCMIADYLRRGIAPGWTWFHPPNGGERPAIINKAGKRISPEGGRLQRMGARPGVSDIILAGPPHGTIHALELKQKGAKPNAEQDVFMAEVIAAGGRADWADNVNDAVAILTRWGAVSTRLHIQAG